MSAAPPAFPKALDDDDDDVSWALQTAAVQWDRGGYADAIVWLRRAAQSAVEVGEYGRAAELTGKAQKLEHWMTHGVLPPSNPPPATIDQAVDDLLSGPSHDDEAPVVEASEVDGPTPSLVDAIELEAQGFGSLPGETTSPSSLDEVEILDDDLIEEIAEEPPDPVPVSLDPSDIEPEDDSVPQQASVGFAASDDAPATRASALPSTPDDEALAALLEGGDAGSPADQLEASAAEKAPELKDALVEGEVTEVSSARHIEADVPSDREVTRRTSPEIVAAALAAYRESEGAAASAAPVSVAPASIAPASIAPASIAPESVPVAPESIAPVAPESVPVAPESIAPVASVSEAPPTAESPQLGGVPAFDVDVLAQARGLEDVPPETQEELVHKARVEALRVEEEVSAFGLALVLAGRVAVMPTIAESPCGYAVAGEPVFAQGNLEDGVALRVVATEDGTRVAVWQPADFENVLVACPWVADELRAVADRYQALAGAAMGPLGERLDDTMRHMVMERCELKHLLAGDVFLEAGKPVAGLAIVGAGRLELVNGDTVVGELHAGDLVFPNDVLSHGRAPHTVRAGKQGALVLATNRMAAHELMVSVPPLLELLAS
jgi:hypothetical protein